MARIFGLAVDSDPSERARVVAAECGSDHELEREVLELIAADERSGDVLGGLTAVVRQMLASGSDVDTAPDSSLPIAVGDVVDRRYRVERIIGSGGMGVVVEAVHIELRERVAMKLLHPQIVRSSRLRERFLREARAVASVKSPHIVRMRDVGIDEHDAPYMVMDLLAGVDLATLLAERGPLPVEDAVLVVLQACDALAVAHDAGIVHRDIKPANLFLEQATGGATTLKLLDFGVSKHSDDDATLTQSGDLVGSPAYMSPEQLRSSRDVDARTDIWSLGVVLYELVAGRRPFAASSKADLYTVVLQQTPAPLPDVPPRLASAISRCLEKDPEQRFASVNELAAQLAPLAGAAGYAQAARVAKTTGVVAPIDVDAPRSRARWIAAAVIALVVAGSVAFLLERQGETAPNPGIEAVDAAAVASFEPSEPPPPMTRASAVPPENSSAREHPRPPPVPTPKPVLAEPAQPASTGLDPYGSRL